MIDFANEYNPSVTLSFDLNDFVGDIIKDDISEVDGIFPDQIDFGMGPLTPQSHNKFLVLLAKIQRIIDTWYELEDFVLTCPKCNKFADLDDWSETSMKDLDEDKLVEMANEIVKCPHCHVDMALADVIYENHIEPEVEEEFSGWEAGQSER